MKKNIIVEVSEEAYTRLMNGKSVPGLLKKAAASDAISFDDWKQSARKRFKERKTGELDFGYVTETAKHVNVYGKYPKSLGLNGIQSAMSRDNKQALGIVADMEIVENN